MRGLAERQAPQAFLPRVRGRGGARFAPILPPGDGLAVRLPPGDGVAVRLPPGDGLAARVRDLEDMHNYMQELG